MENNWLKFFRKKELKIIFSIVILFVVLEVGLNWWARTALLKTLTNDAKKKVELKAEISWMNLLDLYQGRVDWVKVKGKNCVVSGIEIEELELKNQGFTYKLPLLLSEQRLEIFRLQPTQIKAVISETALSSYLALTYPEFQPVLSFTPEKISLKGTADFLGRTVTVEMSGEMNLTGVKTLRFYPKELLVSGQTVPEDFVKFIGNQIPLEFSIMSDLPLKITQLSFRNGALVLELNEE